MDIENILARFENFKEKRLKDRFFKHATVELLLESLPPSNFDIEMLGHSVRGLSISLVTWGRGDTKIFLWSQMHGDEATGTMAVFDFFNFLQSDEPSVKVLAEKCTLFFVPMVNPDGASAFTRRNSQQIDINRDYLQLVSPEARILKECRDRIKPHFGFNLHDQITLWSVTGSLRPATLSFLAPSYDEACNVNGTREKAMFVIADMFKKMDRIIPNHIGLFKDEYEPRAFGDNFQAAGTSTILIEAGGYSDDFEKQEIRKFYFGAMLSGLYAIASKSYEQQKIDNYFKIPHNNKQIFHILINHVQINGITVSVGLNYDECPTPDGYSTVKTYHIEDIGDLSFCDAYQKYDATTAQITGEITIFKNADFQLFQDGKPILAFEHGKLL